MSENQIQQAAAAYGEASRVFYGVAARHQEGEATDEELRLARLAENQAREAWQAALKAAGMAMPSCVRN